MLTQPPFLCALCLSLAAPGTPPARADFDSHRPGPHAHARARSGKPCRDAKGPARADAPALEALIEKARRGGALRVIVTLAVPFEPEGDLANARAVRGQRRAIAAAQQRLLRRLRGHRISSVKRFETIPSLALSADAAALVCIKSAPEVARVQEDQVDAPLSRH